MRDHSTRPAKFIVLHRKKGGKPFIVPTASPQVGIAEIFETPGGGCLVHMYGLPEVSVTESLEEMSRLLGASEGTIEPYDYGKMR